MKPKLEIFHLFTAILLGSAITACSSDDDEGGSAAVPANAVTIDSSPAAESSATAALVTGNALVTAFGTESVSFSARDAINTTLTAIKKERAGSVVSTASGVAFNEPCDVSGSISGDSSESATSESGSITFSNCNDGFGLTLTGTVAFNSTWTTPDGPYSDSVSGGLIFDFGGGGVVNFGNLNFAINGNDSPGNGDYTITAYTFSMDFLQDGASIGGGFAVNLVTPITGNQFDTCELNGGQILISGAAGSQARVTINSDGSAIVEFHAGDGNFIPTDNSPFACFI